MPVRMDPASRPHTTRTVDAPACAPPPAPAPPAHLDDETRRRDVDAKIGATLDEGRAQSAGARRAGGVLGFRLGRTERKPRGRVREAIARLFWGGKSKGVAVAVGGAMMASVFTGCATTTQQTTPEPTRPTTSTSQVQERVDAAARAEAARVVAQQAARRAHAHVEVNRIARDVLGHALPQDHAVHRLADRLVDDGHAGQVPARARAALERLHRAELRDTFARWNEHAPRNDYTHVVRDGETIDARTAQMLDRAQLLMQERFGHEGFAFTVVQGSFSTGVAASAGTHDGGGAIDVHTASYARDTVDDMVRALRAAGFAAWSRGRGFDSFDPHIHAVAIGDRLAAYGARDQVQQYFDGRNGLADRGADPDARLGRHAPQWAERFDV